MLEPQLQPLPASWDECRQRGWHSLDILLVTGDAYIDHPSFGVALIGRLLESKGYRVAILAQPRYDTSVDFCSFPPPQLFCGVTAGNLDSIVANYTGNSKVRDRDMYSPHGNPWRGETQTRLDRRRPDRASLIYSNLARSAFPGVPIILGGIEASLRRFSHYDFQQNRVRASLLTDAKADLLVYGMGEKAIIEVAGRCAAVRGNLYQADLAHIPGTCQRLTDGQLDSLIPPAAQRSCREYLFLPSLKEVLTHPVQFLEAELEIDRHARACANRILLQKQQTHWLWQNPPAPSLTSAELDTLYELPFTRRPHAENQDIPAYRMIKDSVTIVRGCPGNCSFCAIARHQGPAVVSRSARSIATECETIAKNPDFHGTITDLGGPTANLYGSSCAIGSCSKHDCLYPRLCPNLRQNEENFLSLLDSVSAIAGIRHVYISSGLRMEPLLKTPRLMKKIIRDHTPGALKIAPEHSDSNQLQLMHKEPHTLLQKFVEECRAMGKRLGKRIELTAYVIASHPGSTEKDARALVTDFKKLQLPIRQFQDFTPTPGTISTAMFVSGLHPETKKPIPVPRNHLQRMAQRRILERRLLQKAKKENNDK